MNMLNTQMRAYQSYDTDGRNAIAGIVRSGQAERLNRNGDWDSVASGYIGKNEVYRLKLKEGDNVVINEVVYEIVSDRKSTSKNGYPTTMAHLLTLGDHNEVRTLTPEEIQAVQPEFNRGDVISFEHSNGCGLMRMVNDEDGYMGYFSILIYGNKIIFNSFGASFKSHKHATPDQIKQLEREEMKHGKKWTGDGYDDWLTADGLTWNELIEHDVEGIEFYCNNRWVASMNDKSMMTSYHSQAPITEINKYRLKPEESFVDMEIDWSGNEPQVKHPNDTHWLLNGLSLRVPMSDYFINRYVFADGSTCIYPVKTNEDKCFDKAVKARFVKVVNNEIT